MKTQVIAALCLLVIEITGQTSWLKILTNTHRKLNAIDFPSTKVGYIGGNDSLLLKSSDGGFTWSKVNFTGVQFNLGGTDILNLDFVDENTGFMVVGPYGSAYKTTNGGLSWTQLQPAGNLCFLHGLFFFDALNGFVGGAGCFQGEVIEKLTTGNFSTTTINSPTWNNTDRVVDFDFLNNSFGLAVSRGGNILRTTNGGVAWDSIPTGQDEGTPLTGVAIINATLAYASYDAPGKGAGLLTTTDGGLTWTEDGNSATFFYPGFLCVHHGTDGKIYSGARPSLGNSGLIFESTASVWSIAGVTQPINDMSSYAGGVVFGVGDSGLVVVNKLPNPVGIQEAENSDFLVYPNPVGDYLNISLPQSAGAGGTLRIFDVAGGLVKEQICESVNPVNVSLLVPGVYLLEWHSAGGTSRSRFIRK